MSAPSSRRIPRLDIPQEHQPVAADACEARVVGRYRDVQHGVPVCVVPLDRARRLYCVRSVAGARDRAGEVHGAVGGAG